ncbi:MAG: 30S ribosome-binding factor RbfA [Spirochaetia bacterium]|nr:30S ribosome-binding factor RbfA [Spirochaetia bacterium]
MNEIRLKRLEILMAKELSQLIIRRRLKDERIGLVSVSRISLSPDLSTATVFISPFGSEEENRDTWHGMISALKSFQSEVSRNLRLRQTPRLRLEIDNSIKEGDRMIEMIEQQESGL